MNEENSFGVAYALICDDVREENNRKQILIGVYTGGIVLTAVPAVLRLTAWCELNNVPAGSTKLQLRALFGANAEQVFSGDVELSCAKLTKVAHFAFQMLLRFQSTGELILQMRLADTLEWQTIKAMNVSLAHTSAST